LTIYAKFKERGMSYVVKGMTIHYGSIPKSKDTSIKARNSADLIKEAVQKGYRKVNVKFVKLKKSNFPASISHLPNVKKIIGTQKISTFDVVDESLEIIDLLKNPKNVEKIYFV
jgi:hypothetical protein